MRTMKNKGGMRRLSFFGLVSFLVLSQCLSAEGEGDYFG